MLHSAPAVVRQTLLKRIREVTPDSFEAVCMDLFGYQSSENPLYKEFLELLQVDPKEVSCPEEIPFLPIELFKQYRIKTGEWQVNEVFTSSGTMGQTSSMHLLRDPSWYQELSLKGFEKVYGSIKDWVILALLPAYLERQGSSLVYMVEQFIKASGHSKSGFYLHNLDQLNAALSQLKAAEHKILLLGVSFALLDLAEQFPQDLSHITLMETGGMKGRREEITRDELHAILSSAFQLNSVHSEYGMTELLSQAWSVGDGLFFPSPTMRIYLREITDPFSLVPLERPGLINVVDLANVDTCSFIATDDIGKLHENGSFEVLGRLDYSDIRGCNLMIGT